MFIIGVTISYRANNLNYDENKKKNVHQLFSAINMIHPNKQK